MLPEAGVFITDSFRSITRLYKITFSVDPGYVVHLQKYWCLFVSFINFRDQGTVANHNRGVKISKLRMQLNLKFTFGVLLL